MSSVIRRFAAAIAISAGYATAMSAQSPTPSTSYPINTGAPGVARVGSGTYTAPAVTPPAITPPAITPPAIKPTVATPALTIPNLSTSTPVTPPPVTGTMPGSSVGHGGTTPPAGEGGVKDLTHTLPPSLFDPFSGESHGNGHGGNGHSGNGHGGNGHDAHEEEHEGHGVYGVAEYLLLRPRRGAFDFALVDRTNDLSPAGQLESMNYELRSGVRAGIGYKFKDSAWSAGFMYTFLRSGTDRTLRAPDGGLIYPTLTRPGVVDQAAFAQGTASLEYNVFDVEVGRRFKLDERFAVRVAAGGRFGTIRQDFDALYDLRDANLSRVRTKANFNGFGPVLNTEGTLKVAGGFHLYAKGSASLLTGTNDNDFRETNNDGGLVLADVQYRTRRVIPVMGAGIGGGWQYHNVAIRVGYEVTNWFGLIDQVRFTNDLAEGKLTTRNTDLSLEGLFVQFAVSY